MTSSYGGGYKPWMGVPGHGNMNVGPVVFDPLGAYGNGNKPVPGDQSAAHRYKPEIPKPKASASNTGIKFGPQIPSGGQRVTPVTGVGGNNPIVGNTSRVGPVQGPQQVQGPSPRSAHNVKIKPAQGPRPAPVPTAPTGSQGGRMAGLWGAITNNPVVKWGGRTLQALNVYDTANNIRQGRGGAATTNLAFMFPKASALVLADQRPAGGALYDEDGKSLLPTLTPEQKALQAKIRSESGDSFRYTDSDTVTEKPTEKELESAYLHPDLPGPKNNPVGGDADPVTPGLQGSGAPGAVTGDNPFAIWAKKYKNLAEKVKPGQAGYEEIQKALGKTPAGVPASAYEGGTKLTDGEFEAPELKSDPKIDFNSGFNVSQDAKDFAAGAISAIKTSASSLQQPNFDGTTQPIGGDSPTDPQPVQDFNNANTNPAEVVGYLGHPLNKQPSAEAEAANAEYGAMKFEFDPVKNMMVRIK